MSHDSFIMTLLNPITNSFGKLCYHRQSLRGVVQDYIISFEEEECDMQSMVHKTYDLFETLLQHFKDKVIKARLIAQVNYLRLNDQHEVTGNEDYHFASYSLEEVTDPKDFYERHMCKLMSRMDSFHQNGSRLMIHHIKHIHIALAMTSSRQPVLGKE